MLDTPNTLTLSGLLTELQDKRVTEERHALETGVGQQFAKQRHGQRTVVTLIEIGKRDVRVVEGDRKDSYSLSIKEFTKFFKRVV